MMTTDQDIHLIITGIAETHTLTPVTVSINFVACAMHFLAEVKFTRCIGTCLLCCANAQSVIATLTFSKFSGPP